MPKMKNVAVVATAVEAARSYARNNPEKARGYADKAADFVDKRTNRKYSKTIRTVTTKAVDYATGTTSSSHTIRQEPSAR